jgi:hypothetical protein
VRLRSVLPAVAPVAAVLLAALVALSGFGGTSDRRTPSSCAVIYRITDQWSGGFTSAVTLINTSNAPIDGWTLMWTFPNGQSALDVWNGVASSHGDMVSIHNTAGNEIVAPASTAVFRFTGAAGSRNELPADFHLNGRQCTMA